MKPTPTFSNDAEHFAIKQLAEITNETESVWRKRIWKREIDYVKCGRSVRVPRNVLLAWLSSRTVVAAKEGLHSGSHPKGSGI